MDAGREVEVGTAEVDHPLEELVDMQVAGLGLVTEAAHHLGPGRGHRLLGHRDLVEVDEGHAHLVGDGRHEVLLRYHAVGGEQPGQRRTLTRLAVEHDLEVVAGEDLAVYEELAQPARRTQHDGGIGTQGRALEMAPMRRLGGSPRWRWRPRTPGRSPPGAASSSPGPAPPS